jgi:hypothetical protein
LSNFTCNCSFQIKVFRDFYICAISSSTHLSFATSFQNSSVRCARCFVLLILPFRHILPPLSRYDSWVPHVRVGPALIPEAGLRFSAVSYHRRHMSPAPCGPARNDDCRGQIRLWGQENPLKVVRRPLSVSGPSPTNSAYLCVNRSRIYALHARSSIHGNIQQPTDAAHTSVETRALTAYWRSRLS